MCCRHLIRDSIVNGREQNADRFSEKETAEITDAEGDTRSEGAVVAVQHHGSCTIMP